MNLSENLSKVKPLKFFGSLDATHDAYTCFLEGPEGSFKLTCGYDDLASDFGATYTVEGVTDKGFKTSMFLYAYLSIDHTYNMIVIERNEWLASQNQNQKG
jgi:hypothetical protein